MTAIIEEYDLDKPTEIGRVEMEGGRAVVKTGDKRIRDQMTTGIYMGGRMYKLEDGEQFVQLVPAFYSGSRVRARLVK